MVLAKKQRKRDIPMEKIIARILQELENKLFEADMVFLKEPERLDNFERTVREACTTTAAEFLSEALKDLGLSSKVSA